MGSQKFVTLIVTAVSLAVIMGTFMGALWVAQANRKGSTDDFLQTQYSSFPLTSSTSQSSSSQNSSDEQSSVETSSEPSEETIIEVGDYINGNDKITVISSENGFIEASAQCGEISMDFSGQMVENSLVATGTDSLNNTVEVSLVFENNTITAQSKPLIMYEESVECIEISGTFIK